MKSQTLIVNCNCKHDFQDEQYGKQRRVATPVNKTRQNGIVKEARCTVCAVSHNKFSQR